MVIRDELLYRFIFNSSGDAITIIDRESKKEVVFYDGDALEIVSEINALLDRYIKN